MRLLMRIGISVLVGLLIALPISAGASDSITLTWAIGETLNKNPQILAAQLRWEALKEDVPQAQSLDDPSFYTMFWGVPDNTPNPFSARETWFGIKQKFPYPGKLKLRGQVALHGALMAEQGYRAVQEDVLRQVKLAYFDLFLIDREIEITRKHLALTREFSHIAQARYATGAVAQGDVLKALVEVSDLGNRVLVLEQRRRAAEAKLNTLLGRDSESALGTPIEFSTSTVNIDLEILKKLALENRVELKAVSLGIEKSESARALAKKSFYPDVMVDFSYWNVRNNTNRWMLMVEAKVPISFWSKRKHDARLRQTEVEKRVWESDYEALKDQILFAVEDAFVKIQIAQNNVDLYMKTIIPQARQTVAALKANYETDRATFLSLVDSERTLLRFELAYYKALVDYGKGMADLARAVGTTLQSYETGETK